MPREASTPLVFECYSRLPPNSYSSLPGRPSGPWAEGAIYEIPSAWRPCRGPPHQGRSEDCRGHHKAGDYVLFGKWSGTEVKLDGEELLIMKESDIMGVLEGRKGKK
jgi:hypothetical protein